MCGCVQPVLFAAREAQMRVALALGVPVEELYVSE